MGMGDERAPGRAARDAAVVESRPGEPSGVFAGTVGSTTVASEVDAGDYLIDRHRFDSEGDWAFCRFSSEEVPAVRFGYQLGSFDIGPDPAPPDPALLQLHLEVMTAEGGLLWVPTGRFPGDALASSMTEKDVRLTVDGSDILRIEGWPTMSWQMRSDDDELEVRLSVDVETVSVLPDAILPQCLFAMWETMGRARGHVRIGSREIEVEGHMFYDHTRVLRRQHPVRPRRMYLYGTLALSDGSGIFAYHAVDDTGAPLDYYCFGIHVDASGRGSFLGRAHLTDLALDADGLPSGWSVSWRGDGVAVEASIRVQPLPLLRGWGGPSAPATRAAWPIFPLVLEGEAAVSRGGSTHALGARGLAEYFDADRWFGND